MAQEDLVLDETTFEEEGAALDAAELSMFDTTSEPGAAAATVAPTPGQTPGQSLSANPSSATPAPTSTPTAAQIPPASSVTSTAVVNERQQPPAQVPPAVPSNEPAPPTREQIRANTLSQLEQTFTVSEEDAVELLGGNFNKVLPKAMANLAMTTFEHTVAAIVANLPAIIRQEMVQTTNTNREWEQFFTEYPQFAGKQNEVYQLAGQYRQLNPQMPADQFKKEIAALAGVRLGIAPTRTEVSVQTPPAVSRQVQQPPAAMRPHSPAAPGVVGAPPTTGDNFFENLFQEFSEVETRD